MGAYRLFTGSDGESHIEEISAEALWDLKKVTRRPTRMG